MTDEKNRLRKTFRVLSAGLDDNYKRDSSRIITEKVIASPAFVKSDSIFIYASTQNEPDTFCIIEKALKAGKNVYLPRCGKNYSMKAIRIFSADELNPGYMGIPEPTGNEEAGDIDLAVIPCISASPGGRRLGHGAGFYDRFLSEHKEAKKICLCFGRLLCGTIPMDEHDIYMDNVITE